MLNESHRFYSKRDHRFFRQEISQNLKQMHRSDQEKYGLFSGGDTLTMSAKLFNTVILNNNSHKKFSSQFHCKQIPGRLSNFSFHI